MRMVTSLLVLECSWFRKIVLPYQLRMLLSVLYETKYCEIFKNIFFYRKPSLAASAFKFFYFIFLNCKLKLYNLKPWTVIYLKWYFMLIHLQFYFGNFFFTCGDINFDWLFFDEIEHVLFFLKFWSNWFDQTKCAKFCYIHYQVYLIQ